MISNEFVKAEMLAEDFIREVAKAKELLAKKKDVLACLTILAELEKNMEVVLAQGNEYDIDHVNRCLLNKADDESMMH